MGHERIGFLPRTKQWNAIVEQLSSYDGDEQDVAKIMHDTLNAIKKTYEAMPFDESVIKALSFLGTLAFSAKQDDQIEYLNRNGYEVDSNLSLFSLMASAQKYIATEKGSLEINKIAKDSALQAVIEYQQAYQTNQLSFLPEQTDKAWKDAGTGAAFCQLSRAFFAAFTDRQIKYYVERVAASSIDDYDALRAFSTQLTTQSNAISGHAFDISKITQSFAAGWFNKNATVSFPDETKVQGFLHTAFGKLREEFRREAEGK